MLSTTTHLFQPKRRTTLNCRDNCQTDLLIGKYTRSDFTPNKLPTRMHDFELKQPTNFEA
ncbi:hypothetical protein FWP29_25265 [Vibrio parahaemolyticus]|nr:hypothetical protein [Vibrio parahaemolyticus]EGQ9507898.1 hypothetical protein [Vibrio parahaemolyticus]EGQ9814290.1 hypothetical protein [Vibrio parahaemolyticus]EGR1505136.1 hypothetical protein [Vibrio parahaemolyticus]EGR1670252.1 hypothetical protein [Vibrio parahaemolyticus]